MGLEDLAPSYWRNHLSKHNISLALILFFSQKGIPKSHQIPTKREQKGGISPPKELIPKKDKNRPKKPPKGGKSKVGIGARVWERKTKKHTNKSYQQITPTSHTTKSHQHRPWLATKGREWRKGKIGETQGGLPPTRKERGILGQEGWGGRISTWFQTYSMKHYHILASNLAWD